MDKLSGIIKLFINKYNWNGIKYLSNDCKAFEKSDPAVALYVLCT